MREENRKKSDERMEHILEQIVQFTQLNFKPRLPLSEKGDELDAIIIGLNTLGEELNAAKIKQPE
jgi:hypothetical protein